MTYLGAGQGTANQGAFVLNCAAHHTGMITGSVLLFLCLCLLVSALL